MFREIVVIIQPGIIVLSSRKKSTKLSEVYHSYLLFFSNLYIRMSKFEHTYINFVFEFFTFVLKRPRIRKILPIVKDISVRLSM